MTSTSKIAKRKQQELKLIDRVAIATRKAVITGPAGARLLGLSTYSWIEQVDLVLPGCSNSWGTQRPYPDRVYRSAKITEQELSDYHGFRVASLARCLFDSYRYHGRTEALVQIESARWKHKDLSVKALLSRTSNITRGNGIREFEALIRYSCDTCQSPLETLVRDAILQAMQDGTLTGIQSIEHQVAFTITDQYGERTKAIVDALLNGFIVIEADGAVKTSGEYGDEDTITRSERHRERELQNRGLVVLRVTWKDVTSGEFIQKLKRLLEMYPVPVARPA
ncbi:hypothetical protein CGLAUT_11380 [Corynebacterium glaucum]|nr:hypothetical protein CGLAUT_11380 [Corynebacterium glaucum]